ncbi:MAG: ABC transporter permease subunit [Anaerolineales bacterium]|nr:ABC transporter permease subunit [Anaerolineales bacterium]
MTEYAKKESLLANAAIFAQPFRLVFRRIVNVALTLFTIAYITSFGLILAERGRDHLPPEPLDAAVQSFLRTIQFFVDHPQSYYWQRADVPAFTLVSDILVNSAGLLLIALGVAFIVGVSLGIGAAVSRNKLFSTLIVVLSTLGISIPSFLLAMLFWVANIQAHRSFEMEVLPSAGFGWDSHLIMPVLVLAMRPLAQIAQVTYVSLTDVLGQDYIRTARAKGLHERVVRNVHALRNVLIPVLTTIGTSLRFSLASLPVVELFFNWPGVGLTLLHAIDLGMSSFVTDLILSFGIFFLAVNLLIEFVFPLIDARLRSDGDEQEREDRSTVADWMRGLVQGLRAWIRRARGIPNQSEATLPALPALPDSPDDDKSIDIPYSRIRIFSRIFKNPSLLLGSILIFGLTGLLLFGGSLTSVSPYETNNVMVVEGEISAPPFPPSTVFPWGSDYVGRDIQSLVLHGARQTLSLAFFGMAARLLLGVILGTVAGWKRDTWLDRFISGAVGVWAAFPVTLFAMLLIQGLGIQQGMWVFIVAISVVGWGEVAQIVRGQVISLKPQPYIESARSVGARSVQILGRHVLPNLMNSLIVLAVLETGGILMLLAELGYLNIFLGGGFQAIIADTGTSSVAVYFSDVPEWAALIANVRNWWRSYPWMALYPGAAFFLSIIAFNILGEGLRRFLDESQANLSRLFNRYTFSAGIVVILALTLLLQASTPLGQYRPEGLKFDPQRVMKDIEALSSYEYQGRETGTPGTELAAQYIAKRMEENGLLPAGEKQTYLQALLRPRRHLTETPLLALVGEDGEADLGFKYRQDFAELAGTKRYGEAQATILGIAFGPLITDTGSRDPYRLLNTETRDHILIVRGEDYEKIDGIAVPGILIVVDDHFSIERKDLYPAEISSTQRLRDVPTMIISTELAEVLLDTAGSSLSALEELGRTLDVNQSALTGEGVTVKMSINAQLYEDYSNDNYINVIGGIPGEGTLSGAQNQVIIVSAYYDGLGIGPDGQFYPGANDNASGVAVMLELARLMTESAYKPEKTMIFVAWAGGERGEGLSVVNVMNARPGANQLTVEVVFELSGVGYGSGDSIALGEESSYRLVKLFQSAAGKYNDATTMRGRGPHYGGESGSSFGDRSALTLSVSWDGSDALAHTARDVPAIIDPEKLFQVGRSSLLTLMVLSRETTY